MGSLRIVITGILLCVLLFVPTVGSNGQGSGSLFNPGRTIYKPSRNLGFFGYNSIKEEDNPIPPTGKEPEEIQIPRTVATMELNATDRLPYSPFESNELEKRSITQTTGEGTLTHNASSIGANDRLSGFMLFPRSTHESVFQGFALNMAYVPDNGEDKTGYYSIDGSVTLGVPCPAMNTPLFVTPEFNWLQMTTPLALRNRLNEKIDLYSPGLRFKYLIPVNDNVLFDLNFRAGVSSDFHADGDDAIRLTGSASMMWKMTDDTRLVLGASCTQISKYEVLPIVGFLWKPSDDFYLEALFPRPKVAWKLPPCTWKSPDAPYWMYLAGEFEGNRWLVRGNTPLMPGMLDHEDYRITYYDFRAFLGLERQGINDLSWALEGGLLFGRHLDVTGREGASGYSESFKPKTTGLVRLKVRY